MLIPQPQIPHHRLFDELLTSILDILDLFSRWHSFKTPLKGIGQRLPIAGDLVFEFFDSSIGSKHGLQIRKTTLKKQFEMIDYKGIIFGWVMEEIKTDERIYVWDFANIETNQWVMVKDRNAKLGSQEVLITVSDTGVSTNTDVLNAGSTHRIRT